MCFQFTVEVNWKKTSKMWRTEHMGLFYVYRGFALFSNKRHKGVFKNTFKGRYIFCIFTK